MSSGALILALLLGGPAEAATDDLDTLSDRLSRAVKRDRPKLAAEVCSEAAWNDPRLPVRDMIAEGADGNLRMREVRRREQGDRAVVTFRRENPLQPYDTVEVYAVRTEEGWQCEGWDHSAGHARAYLAGLLPARLGEPVDDEALTGIGEDLMAFAARTGPMPAFLVGGTNVVRAVSWIRQMHDPTLAEVHVLPGLDRGVLAWSDGSDVVSLFVERSGDHWQAFHVENAPPSLAGASQQLRIQTTPLPPVPRDHEIVAARERVQEFLTRDPQVSEAKRRLREEQRAAAMGVGADEEAEPAPLETTEDEAVPARPRIEVEPLPDLEAESPSIAIEPPSEADPG